MLTAGDRIADISENAVHIKELSQSSMGYNVSHRIKDIESLQSSIPNTIPSPVIEEKKKKLKDWKLNRRLPVLKVISIEWKKKGHTNYPNKPVIVLEVTKPKPKPKPDDKDDKKTPKAFVLSLPAKQMVAWVLKHLFSKKKYR